MKINNSYLDLVFLTSAASYSQCPNFSEKEIVFVGASNAGKSSAINALSNKKKLAKVSKTPGKTKLFNFFKSKAGLIVDMPGYGYSKVSKIQKKDWSKEIPLYFERRVNLVHVLIFTDARHPMRESDIRMVEMLEKLNIPYSIILTKSDKLSLDEKKKTVLNLESTFAYSMLISTKDHASIAKLRSYISELLSS